MKRILSDADLAETILGEIEISSYCLPSGVKIETRLSPSGKKWAAVKDGMVLNSLGFFEYEPLPSNRDEKFLQRCRFNTIYDVCLALAWNEQGGRDAT